MGRKRSLICGKAINDRVGPESKLFQVWKAMWQRVETHSAYKEVSICKEWELYSNFEKWALFNGYEPGLHLDKDLLSPSGIMYSPHTCCFITADLNKALVVSKVKEGRGLPLGVYHHGSATYQAKISKAGRLTNLITHPDVKRCHQAWKRRKAQNLEELVASQSSPRVKARLRCLITALRVGSSILYTKEAFFKLGWWR